MELWLDCHLPQVQLPIFPQGTSLINPELALQREADQVVCYNGHLPVFTHGAEDLASFQIFTTQLIINGTASYGQIAKAFGVPSRKLKPYAQQYRQRAAKAFFKRMWGERISVVTYQKFPGEDSALDEFHPHILRLINGEEVNLKLAEPGVRWSNGFWLREIRRGGGLIQQFAASGRR